MRKLTTLILSVIMLFSLYGCTQDSIISIPATKINVSHYVGGNPTQWTIDGEEVTALRNWVSNLDCKLERFEQGHSPGDSDGGEFYNFTFSERNYSVFSYVINGPSDCYLLINGNWYSVSNPSNPPVEEPERETLTLEKLKTLSNKESLTWKDFEKFEHHDIGSGLYIWALDINEKCYLLIGGSSIEIPPFYISLKLKDNDDVYLNLPSEDFDNFVKQNNLAS